MILRVPRYYKEFHCIADACKDSCCIGWEIDIDEETFAYYKQVEDSFGKRLKENMANDEENSFVLQEGGRCPFLNKENLCDICITLGEESLCEVCTEYPRFTLEYGEIREKCMALSCEEVGRLLFTDTNSMTFEEREIELDFEEDIDEDRYWIQQLEQIQNYIIDILQYREISIRDRILVILNCSKQIQDDLNNNGIIDIDSSLNKVKYINSAGNISEQSNVFSLLTKRIEVFERMEILDEEWQEIFLNIKKVFMQQSMQEGRYQELLNEWKTFYKNREYEYEQLLVYFIFRYFMKAVYDHNILDKIQLAVVSFLVIRDMDILRYLDNDKCFSVDDRIDIARIYSKEVEHSQDNLDFLSETFLFEEIFTVESLKIQV